MIQVLLLFFFILELKLNKFKIFLSELWARNNQILANWKLLVVKPYTSIQGIKFVPYLSHSMTHIFPRTFPKGQSLCHMGHDTVRVLTRKYF